MDFECLLKAVMTLETTPVSNNIQDIGELSLRNLLSSSLRNAVPGVSGTPLLTLSNSPSSSSSSSSLMKRPSPSASATSTATSSGEGSVTNHRRCNNTTKHSRLAHNELEKTRRANLRTCLERLKELVPGSQESTRNTTLALLTRGRDHIKELDVDLANTDARIIAAERRRADLAYELATIYAGAHALASKNLPVDASQPVDAMPSTPSPIAAISPLRLPECESIAVSERDSPFMLEYSPNSKPVNSGVVTSQDFFDQLKAATAFQRTGSDHSHSSSMLGRSNIDPVLEGLIAPIPISFPKPGIYPYSLADYLQQSLVQ